MNLLDTPRALVEILREIYEEFTNWSRNVKKIVAHRRKKLEKPSHKNGDDSGIPMSVTKDSKKETERTRK